MHASIPQDCPHHCASKPLSHTVGLSLELVANTRGDTEHIALTAG